MMLLGFNFDQISVHTIDTERSRYLCSHQSYLTATSDNCVKLNLGRLDLCIKDSKLIFERLSARISLEFLHHRPLQVPYDSELVHHSEVVLGNLS